MSDPEQKFNNLEKAILDWYVQNFNDPGLISQIKNAKFKSRKWTKVGFYIYLEIPEGLEKVDFKNLNLDNFPISGPQIESEDIEFGGDVLLWGKDGYLDNIEMVSLGSFFNEDIGAFKLS